MKRLVFAGALCFLTHAAWAACSPSSLVFKDGAGNPQTLCAGGASGAFIGQSEPVSSTGAAMDGTAGTAAAGVLTVQGIASMTKLLVTPDSVALPANQSVNVTQFGGNNVATGTGASGNGIPRVTISNDSSLAANQSTNVAQINGQTAANGGVTGSLLVEQGCAGQTVANTNVTPFSLASTTALKLVSKAAAKKVYICAIDLMSGTAQNVALVEGTLTTTNCDTSTAGLAGGTTAATGWNFAANGGLTKGNGQGVVFKSATANLDVCLFSSSTGQISGSITWAQF